MKGCTETITLFNARRDGDTGGHVYVPTVIAGCAWHGGQRVGLDAGGGLAAADEYTVRIPADADFGGREYADPIAWRQSDGVGRFTIQGGDWTPARLKAVCAECFTVMGVTDNRRAPRGKHWRIVGS